MEIKENEYVSMKLDLGAMGEVYLMQTVNTKKEKPTDPDFRILKRDSKNNLQGCGVAWITVKKQNFTPNIEMEHTPK